MDFTEKEKDLLARCILQHLNTLRRASKYVITDEADDAISGEFEQVRKLLSKITGYEQD